MDTGICDPAKGFECQSVSNPNDKYLFYEPKDGKYVPLRTQSVLATDHFSHIAVPEQFHPFSNGRSVVPFSLDTIPVDQYIALAPQPYDEGQLSVDEGRMFSVMTAASQEHSFMSSLHGDQGYLHHCPPPQRLLQTNPPVGEPLNSHCESAFGTLSASSSQQLGGSFGMSQPPFMGWNYASAVRPIATGNYMLDSSTFGPSLHSTLASHPMNDDLNCWHSNLTSSDALFEGAYTMATNASHVSNTWKPGMELLPEPTNTADHLLMETGFLSEELLAFEDVGMISAQHSTQVVPHSLTSSKVGKPKTPIQQSKSQVKDRITGTMDQMTDCIPVQAGSGKHQRTNFGFGAKQRVQKAKALVELRGECLGRLKHKCHFDWSPYMPCKNCLITEASILEIPCTLQATIGELFLFRSGPPADNPDHPLNFFMHRRDLLTLQGTENQHTVQSRVLELTQGTELALQISVSPYVPLPCDKTAYEWSTKDGTQRMEMPPYRIDDVEDAKARICAYVQIARPVYLKAFLDRSNELLWNTFDVAQRSKSPMVQTALSIWSTTRIIERTWRICGAETLGLEPVSDSSNPWNGIIPVTPIMDQQLDQIVIRGILAPWKQRLLRQLNEKIYDHSKARENWFEIYLTIFILLNSTEVQLAHSLRFSRRYGFSGRYGPRGKYGDAEKQFHDARTLLAHFHHVCRGYVPFSVDPDSDGMLGNALLDRDSVAYLRTLQQDMANIAPSLPSLRAYHQYETTLYWCHQMFFGGWESGPGHIRELPE